MNGIVDDITPGYIADVLMKVCPHHAQAIALALHERMCQRGDVAQCAVWKDVIRELPAAGTA